MNGNGRLIWLVLAALPYATLVGIDTWMHEATRKVPRVEAIVHWTLAPVLICFFLSVLTKRSAIALSLLAIFAALLVFDALRFHRLLARSERRVHAAAGVALSIFVTTWLYVDFVA